MAPIRVGVLGISGQSGGMQRPGLWATNSHLPSILKSPAYELVALCNSSVEAAHKAISYHKLPSTTKAYGSPEDLAKDPDVDLIVVSVNVQKHVELAKPAILNGKDIFVEWPLGASLAEAEELTKLANETGVKTMVGVQGRASPLIAVLKKIIDEGKIGRVVSSHVFGSTAYLPTDTWIVGAEYYLDMKSGGNAFYIGFGHFLDSFTYVLGDFETLQSTLQVQWPSVAVLDMSTGEVVNPAHPRTAPDHTMVQGRLKSGAVASISYRHNKVSVDEHNIRWIISGTQGEIEVTSPASTQWQIGDLASKLRVRYGKESEIEEVDYLAELATDHEDVTELNSFALNIGLVYEAFRKGNTARYATFEDSLKTHRLLNRIVEASDFKF
ncbi:putative oxidoreductase [Podospora didyma]|uniref:Oxidoreductase n=1 Tax=Podospora didyma TaxID=330526 RepID=A0AAE0TVK8_9PEZI|nr:putative oxidoreductase [Podospora didyma]